jgi:hypothetical protein
MQHTRRSTKKACMFIRSGICDSATRWSPNSPTFSRRRHGTRNILHRRRSCLSDTTLWGHRRPGLPTTVSQVDERATTFALSNTNYRACVDVQLASVRTFQGCAVREYNLPDRVNSRNSRSEYFPDCKPYSLLFFGKRVYVCFQPPLTISKAVTIYAGLHASQRRYCSLPQSESPPFPSPHRESLRARVGHLIRRHETTERGGRNWR